MSRVHVAALLGAGTLAASLVSCDAVTPSASASAAASTRPAPSARRRAPRPAPSAAPARSADDPSTPAGSAAPATPSAASAPSAAPAGSGDPAGGGGADGGVCPPEMALVYGLHCRNAEQRCAEYVKREGGEDDPNRCLRFEEPSRCLDEGPPRLMRFCMDKWEYPGRKGEKPRVLVDWTTASRLCEEEGKRLCTESEFTFACEGEDMRPYATGYRRDAEQCNIDKPFVTRRRGLLPEPQCAANTACAEELDRLDGRREVGDGEACASPFGIYELNGNVNEWVSQMWRQPPHRSALKGGWWGPVRNRCRAIAQSHAEDYLGYEVGFRCCSDPAKQ
ncbi:MAG: SUMF1/EgtB/PvdO family nonheme iron enzyme [Polyangiaceae bacterium]|nr:SUMF1/EgtB/PvdO family nonheme iron enzyme [Polyangiaceae bacterium]